MTRFGYVLHFSALVYFFNIVIVNVISEQICVRDPPSESVFLGEYPDFSHFVESTGLFVDNTELISVFADSRRLSRIVNLITFPRRFGKSTNLLMIGYFYGIEVSKDGKRVPQELTRSYHFFTAGKVLNENSQEIAKFIPAPNLSQPIYSGLIKAHLAQYPVIYVEFKGMNILMFTESPFEEFLSNFHIKISDTFKQHEYLSKDFLEIITSTSASQHEKDTARKHLKTFKNIMERNGSPDSSELQESISFLSERLLEKFSKPAIILIDEYDAIFNSLYLYGKKIDATLQSKIQEFYGEFLTQTLLYNKFFIQTFLTGVLKIQNAGVFSLNFLSYYNMLTPNLNKYYGISRKEASLLFDHYKIPNENRTIIQDYYDGYRFYAGNGEYEHYYNIFSLLNYLENVRLDKRILIPVGYWTGSGIIPKHFQNLMVRPDVYRRLQTIVFEENGCLEIQPDYYDLASFSLTAIIKLENFMLNPNMFTVTECLIHYFLQLLFVTGYLTNIDDKYFTFPNLEVKTYVKSIFKIHYQGVFRKGYAELVTQFETFLFDDQIRSTDLEDAFLCFIRANEHTLQPHLPPSRKSGSTTNADTGDNFQIEINEAFFSTVLRFVTLSFKKETHIAFEKVVSGRKYIDIFAHNGKIQAIVEIKYNPSMVSLNSTVIQASQYVTTFKYPYKFIGILGRTDGSIETRASFERITKE